MFTDIVNSTPLIALLGDEAWRHLLQWHDRTLQSLFQGHLGERVDHTADGFFVAFESAEGALNCARDIQRTLAAHRRDHGFAPQVRIGVHLDRAINEAGNYRGYGVHVAARVGAIAQAGEILISRLTLDATTATFTTTEGQMLKLKGVREPVELLALIWDRAAPPQPLD